MRRIIVLLLLVIVGCTPTAIEPVELPTLAPLPDEVLPLFFWETATGQLVSAGDIDFWQFGAESGDNIFIRAVTRGVTVRISILQGETLIIEGDNAVETTLPASDLYRVRVESISGSGQYDIGLGYSDQPNPANVVPTALPEVVGVPTPTPPFSSLGEFITRLDESREFAELLTAISPQHVYTIQGTAGQIVNFELYRIAGTFDPILRFYDTDSNLLAMDDNSLGNTNARLLNITLPEDGLYSVQVDGKGLFGDYTLVYTNGAVEVAPDPLPTVNPTTVAPYSTPMIRFAAPEQRLEDYTPSINSIVRAGDFQRFSFFAEAGEQVSLIVEPFEGSSIVPAFEIFDPEGAQITFASALDSGVGGAAVSNNLIIGQTGAHIIIVTAENGTVGQFLISFGRGTTVRDEYQGVSFSNDQISADISRIATRHIWRIEVNAGDVISVAVSPNDSLGFDPVVELVTAEGDLVYIDDDGGVGNAAFLQTAEIRDPATYLLRIYDESGSNTGAYTLLWNFVNRAPTPTPLPALANILVIRDTVPEGQYQFYAFQGQAGQQLQIDAIAGDGSGLDPVLALLNPSGDIILEADDSDNSLNPSASITLPETGTYQVRINGYLSSGDFELTVAQVFNQ